MNQTPIVFFVFAGREPNMELQRPYIDRLLDLYPNAQYHVWNLTRNAEDDAYIRGLHDPERRVLVFNQLQVPNTWPVGCRRKLKRPKWCGCKDCRPSPYEKVYEWYVGQDAYHDAVFVKLDDDIVFIETERFSEVLDVLAEHPNAVVSANVVNNVVSAKHDHELRQIIEDQVGPDASQKAWFDLHATAEFARDSHDWFLDNWQALTRSSRYPEVARSLPGERVSINTICFTFPTLVRLDAVIRHPLFRRMGDEGAICNNFLPRITVTFRTAHLYFGPQRIAMTDAELDEYRRRYAEVAKGYLGG